MGAGHVLGGKSEKRGNVDMEVGYQQVREPKMFEIRELKFGYNDAENYRRKDEKELFNNLFVRTEHLEQLCENGRYFLIGDKGTGKTAYAVYLVNNFYSNIFAALSYIRETDYKKFMSLKQERHLVLSDYTDIWKVILLLLLSQNIKEKEKSSRLMGNVTKFRSVNKAIDEYYSNAFSPEIQYALNFIEQSKLSAGLMLKYVGTEAEKSKGLSFSEVHFQTNLMYIQKHFQDALSSLKLEANHLLLIDGIDIRPSSIQYEDYLECIKGLANAVWSLNNDFLANIKGSKGRMRVVLLIRPDIFNSLGLQNQNNKVRDNSALLNWQTTYPLYKKSLIFQVADRLLSSQQKVSLSLGDAWDYYFPYKILEYGNRERDSFISFLRFSLYRPRDIITMLKILQNNFIKEGRHPKDVFNISDFNNAEFRREYADYLAGEVKDSLSFYHTAEEYELFLKFFEFLEGKPRFSYDEYIRAYDNFIKFLEGNNIRKPNFFESADAFLQYLYELNVICYVEVTEKDDVFLRWCFRERGYANISPKIKTHLSYEIHYGIGKAFNLGRTFRRG